MKSDEPLAGRLRKAFRGTPMLSEKRMFGGLAFMVNGKLCVSVGHSRIMCRIDPAQHDGLVRNDGCRTMTMKGREYRGYISVDESALKSDRDIQRWVKLALDFNGRAKASKPV